MERISALHTRRVSFYVYRLDDNTDQHHSYNSDCNYCDHYYAVANIDYYDAYHAYHAHGINDNRHPHIDDWNVQNYNNCYHDNNIHGNYDNSVGNVHNNCNCNHHHNLYGHNCACVHVWRVLQRGRQ